MKIWIIVYINTCYFGFFYLVVDLLNIKYMFKNGIEPLTQGFSVLCSTAELLEQNVTIYFSL